MRRMFSKTITSSGKFLKMPQSSRLLYYDLGMQADDDGYAEWFTVMKMTGAAEQDLAVLNSNGFVKVFDENVLVIKDWKENNYIQKDRYTPSKYLNVYDMDTECIQVGDTGKVRIGKDRLGKVINIAETSSAQVNDILNSFKQEINPTIGFGNKTQRKACEELIRQFGYEKVVNTMTYYKSIRGEKFSPVITTPCQLRDKMGQLIAYYNKNNQTFGDKVIEI